MRWNRWLVVGVPLGICTAMLTAASSCSGASGINNQPQQGSEGGNAGQVPSAAPTSTPAPVAHVGDSVSIAGNGGEKLSVQIVRVVDPASGTDEFNSASAGKHFVAVQFKLTNTGTAAYSDAPGNDAKVLDGQGQSFSSDFSDTTAGPSFADNQVNIGPGASQLGFITFQMPDGDHVAKVQFTTDSGFGQTGEWLVP